MATKTKGGRRNFLDELTAKVGGPSFLDPRQLLYASPIIWLSSIIFRQGFPNAVSLNAELTTQTFSIVATYFFAISLSALTKTRRERKSLNLAEIIFFGAVIGAAKFYSVELLLLLLFSQELAPGRIGALWMNVLIFSLLLFPGLAFAESKRIDFETDRGEMVSRRARASLELAKVEKINPRIEQFLIDIRSTEDSQEKQSQLQLAMRIRNFVETEVRPLSRRIWEIEDRKIVRFTFRELLVEALRHKPFHPRFTAIACAPIPFLASLSTSGFADASIQALAGTLVIFFIFSLGQAVGKKFGFLPIVFLVSIFLSASSVVLMNFLLFTPVTNLPGLTSWGLMVFWIGSLAVFTALTSTALSKGSSLAAELADLNESTQEIPTPASSVSVSNRELANFLHSTVQNQLLSAAMTIESEVAQSELPNASIKTLEKVLLEQVANGFTPEQSLEEILEEVVGRWSAVLRIETRVCLNEDLRPGPIFAQVIDEGISNAVRHGRASLLSITISAAGELIEIQIEDDGFGPLNGAPSLGHALFNDSTNKNWQLEAKEAGGSRLTLNLTR